MNSSTFGLVAEGRPVLIDWFQIDAHRLSARLERAIDIRELSFFLLPNVNLPPGMAATLYYSWEGSTVWDVLGAIRNDKPSAIFHTKWSNDQVTSTTLLLGISLENEDAISNLEESQAVQTDKQRGDWAVHLAKDLYNFLTSFSQTTSQGEILMVPSNAMDRWLHRFHSKYKNNPNFVYGNQD